MKARLLRQLEERGYRGRIVSIQFYRAFEALLLARTACLQRVASSETS